MKLAIRKVVRIEDLYLDPNNPRITPLDKVRDTPVKDIKNKPVQQATLKLMNEEASAGVRYYVDILSKEGFLDSFPLRVAALPDGGYVLGDGNTRVTAALTILADVGMGKYKLSNERLEALRNVPVEEVGTYGGVDWLKLQAKIHLHGARTWGASKRAGWIDRLLRKPMTNEVRQSILQSDKTHVKWAVDSIAGWHSLRSHFEGRVFENHFNVVKEIFKNPANRRYLGWNAKQNVFTNKAHIEQLVDLMSPVDKSRPRITANSSKMLRTMGEDPAMWALAKGGKPKDIKYLKLAAGKEKQGLNDMILKLAVRLEDMKMSELNNFDVETASRLVSLIGRKKTEFNRLVGKKARVTVNA